MSVTILTAIIILIAIVLFLAVFASIQRGNILQAIIFTTVLTFISVAIVTVFSASNTNLANQTFRLSSLTVSSGTLTPAYSNAVDTYTNVAGMTSSITIIPTLESDAFGTTLTLEGSAITSGVGGTYTLASNGTGNIATIVLTTADGNNSRTITINNERIIDPESVSGLALYLRADTGITESGGNVSNWEAINDDTNDFTQGTESAKPTLTASTFGDNPSIYFDGDDYLTSSLGAFLSGASGVVITLSNLPTNEATAQDIFASSDTAVGNDYLEFNNRRNVTSAPYWRLLHNELGSVTEIEGDTTIVVDTDYIITWRSSGTAYTFDLNGSDEGFAVNSGADDGDWFGDIAALDNVTVGAFVRTTPGNFATAHIGLILVYEPDISDADLALLQRMVEWWKDGNS